MLGLPHVATLCGYLSFYFLLHRTPTWSLKLVMTHWSEQWLSLEIKTSLETELVFDTGRHGCVTAKGGEVWGWLALFDPKLSPMQLASLVAFKITRPPSPHISCPLSHVWPPTSLHVYHISYKGPNKYSQPLSVLPQLLQQPNLKGNIPVPPLKILHLKYLH